MPGQATLKYQMRFVIMRTYVPIKCTRETKRSSFETENVKYENIFKNQHSKLTKSKVRYFKFMFQKLTKTDIQNKSAKKKSS